MTAARTMNTELAAMTITTDVRGRKRLADGGMQTHLMPDAELSKAAEWCWNQFVSRKGKDKHIDKLIEVYTQARQLHKDYYGPKRLPV